LKEASMPATSLIRTTVLITLTSDRQTQKNTNALTAILASVKRDICKYILKQVSSVISQEVASPLFKNQKCPFVGIWIPWVYTNLPMDCLILMLVLRSPSCPHTTQIGSYILAQRTRVHNTDVATTL